MASNGERPSATGAGGFFVSQKISTTDALQTVARRIGILTLSDNIVFNFSEDIEYNYLNAVTNFEVKGEVNNQNVSEAVSLQFTGQASVESEAQRNFSGKDLAIDLMIRPDETGRDMPLFSHGTNGKKLQLWLTGDYRLKAVVDDQTFVSDTAIVSGGFTQVALVIEHSTLNIEH